eukprot:1157805-Pelagomonas_calceolata.AAC.12
MAPLSPNRSSPRLCGGNWRVVFRAQSLAVQVSCFGLQGQTHHGHRQQPCPAVAALYTCHVSTKWIYARGS